MCLCVRKKKLENHLHFDFGSQGLRGKLPRPGATITEMRNEKILKTDFIFCSLGRKHLQTASNVLSDTATRLNHFFLFTVSWNFWYLLIFGTNKKQSGSRFFSLFILFQKYLFPAIFIFLSEL